MSIEHDEILVSFITEATEGLSGIQNDFLAIEQAGADVNDDLVNAVFRTIHSIKGSAGFAGLKGISDLAHEMENVLNLVRQHELVPTPEIMQALLDGGDMLESMVHNVQTSNDVDISAHIAALQRAASGEAGAGDGAPVDAGPVVDFEVDIDSDDGLPVFLMVPAADLVNRQQHGESIYILHIDLVSIEKQGRSLMQFADHLGEHGEIIQSYARTAGVGTLNDDLPERLEFVVLYASKNDASTIARTFELDDADVFLVASPEQVDWTSGSPQAPETPEASSAPATNTESTTTPASTTDASSAAPAAPPTPSAKPGAGDNKPAPARAATPTTSSLRVSVTLLDQLMTLAGELVLSRNELAQMIESKQTVSLDSVAARIDRVTSDLQDAIMRTRMQPVSAVFDKFPRVVRDLTRSLNKQADLIIEGREVELDKSIIEAIGDPLTHLIRNSVDHGVEAPDVRRSRGKSETGRIELSASHEGGKVVIRIIDDGGGIDNDRLRRKAVENGLMSAEEAGSLDEREATRLILHAGLSTAEQVTDVSGRGVGMDVVRANIEELGGTIDIESTLGQGTTMSLELPLTLAIIPSLIVRNGQSTYAIPQASASEMLRIRPREVAERIERINDHEVLRLRGNLLPLVRLSTVLKSDSMFKDLKDGTLHPNQRVHIADRRGPVTEADAAESTESTELVEPTERDLRDGEDRREDTVAGVYNIVVVEAGDHRYGLIVDELVDTQEIVVKPLGRHLKQCRELAGATILGNGDVAMILDVAGIANAAHLATEIAANADAETSTEFQQTDRSTVLLFTNHPEESFAVPLGLVGRLERVSAETVFEIGDQPVMHYRDATLPLIRIEDHITAESPEPAESLSIVVFEVNDRELGLIAPVIDDIREFPAELDASTLNAPGVLGSRVVDGRTVRFLDIITLAKERQPSYFERIETPTEAATTQTILLAEDSGFFRTQVKSFLESRGYEVLAYEDGALALEGLREHRDQVDLIVTDIEMPNMDGYELCRAVREDAQMSSIPVIALTSLAEESDIQKGYEAGVDDYQIKMNRDALIAAASRLIRHGRSAAQELAA